MEIYGIHLSMFYEMIYFHKAHNKTKLVKYGHKTYQAVKTCKNVVGFSSLYNSTKNCTIC